MASAKEPLIKIQGLTKEYYNRVVVDNILEIWDSCFAFLGPNGAGKTTTILMLLGLVKPSNGTAYIFGTNILKSSGKIRFLYPVDNERAFLSINNVFNALNERFYFDLTKIDDKSKENVFLTPIIRILKKHGFKTLFSTSSLKYLPFLNIGIPLCPVYT